MLLYGEKLQNNMCLLSLYLFYLDLLAFFFCKKIICYANCEDFLLEASICNQNNNHKKIVFWKSPKVKEESREQQPHHCCSQSWFWFTKSSRSLVNNTALGSFVYSKWPSILFIPNLPLYFQLSVNQCECDPQIHTRVYILVNVTVSCPWIQKPYIMWT